MSWHWNTRASTLWIIRRLQKQMSSARLQMRLPAVLRPDWRIRFAVDGGRLLVHAFLRYLRPTNRATPQGTSRLRDGLRRLTYNDKARDKHDEEWRGQGQVFAASRPKRDSAVITVLTLVFRGRSRGAAKPPADSQGRDIEMGRGAG